MAGGYANILKTKMDDYVHFVYDITSGFPDHERYATTSQLRRAALSVVLNHIEGYARSGRKVYRQFLRTSFGSLKETQYLLEFSLRRGYLSEEEYEKARTQSDEIGAMLWGVIRNLA